VLSERSLDTCAVYAPDMWPIMGLKSAVMVVGGSKMEGGEEGAVCDGDDDDDDDGSVEDSDECGRGPGWNDGVAASGRVVNRMPVETTETYVRSAFSVFRAARRERGYYLLRSSPAH